MKPNPIRPYFERIPQELKRYPHWVMWRYELDKDGKWTKPPYSAKSGWRAKSNDRRTWADFATVEEVYRSSNGKYAGVGFVLSSDDPFVAWDLDHCVDRGTQKAEPWALDIIQQLRSYTELSPSGEGIRIFLKAKLPIKVKKNGNVEVCNNGKYVTVTGSIFDVCND